MKAREDFFKKAFSRNIGLISESEQRSLRGLRIGIAGCGGVGFVYAKALARIGFDEFTISDPDTFDTANRNRQFGSVESTNGRNKAEVLKYRLLDINPYANVEIVPGGVTEDNLDEFLKDVFCYVDGLDFFAQDIRLQVFQRCRKLGIWAVTSAPIGFGATLQVFSPDKGMSYEDYFLIKKDSPKLEKLVAFAAGLTPWPLHIKYMDLSKTSLVEEFGPSSVVGILQCAALMANEVLRIALYPDTVRVAPHYLQFDLRRLKFRKKYLLFGGKNPLQRLIRSLIKRKALAK